MFDVEGFILVGGKSRRMGHDKSQLVLAGERVMWRLQRQLSAITARVRVVGKGVEAFAERDSDYVLDVHSDWGALGGIHAALAACEADWAAIIACDLPFATTELFQRLIQNAGPPHAKPDAVVPIQSDGRPQPLCALYRKEGCFARVEALIAAGEHTPRALLAAIQTRWVPFEGMADLPGADNFFFNMNTPEEYEHAQQIARELNSAGTDSK